MVWGCFNFQIKRCYYKMHAHATHTPPSAILMYFNIVYCKWHGHRHALEPCTHQSLFERGYERTIEEEKRTTRCNLLLSSRGLCSGRLSHLLEPLRWALDGAVFITSSERTFDCSVRTERMRVIELLNCSLAYIYPSCFPLYFFSKKTTSMHYCCLTVRAYHS